MKDREHLPLAVLVWGFLQLLLLAISAAGVPVWSHHPFPREHISLAVMLIGQLILAGWVVPCLVNTWRGWLMVGLLSLSMDEAAGMLSNSPQTAVLCGFACTAIWITGIAFWRREAGSFLQLNIIALITTSLTLGGGIIDYLRWESSSMDAGPNGFTPVSLICGAASLTFQIQPNLKFGVLLQLAVPMAIGSILSGWRSLRRASTSLHLTA